MAGRILVVGSINMDLVVRCGAIPRPGQTLLGGEFFANPGGKGANQAVAVARLGGDCAMLGAVGDDAYGGELIANLAAAGVDVSRVARRADAPSAVALITVSAAGENAIVVAPGANATVTPDDVRAASAAFAAADAVMLQLELPIETVTVAAVEARRHGCRIILDPAPALADLPAELLAVDVISPNTSEAELICGAAAGALDAEAAAARLLAAGANLAVIKLGADGALVADAGGMQRVAPFRVEAVDTTAAGDCFTAALALALTRGESPAGATRYACAAGALACTRRGAQASAPTAAAVEALLAAQG